MGKPLELPVPDGLGCDDVYERAIGAGFGERKAARDAGGADGQPPRAQFLTVAEVASLMRVSKMTVYRLVHNGELPAVRVGRSFRVHAKAVHDLLETLVLRRRLIRSSGRFPFAPARLGKVSGYERQSAAVQALREL